MAYYDKNGIVIRNLRQSDAKILTEEEIAQGWNTTIDKFEIRLRHQAEGKAIALVAEWNGSVAGYVNVYPDAKNGAFANRGYAEIVDFAVLEKYRCRGIGGKLMDVAEQIAFLYSGMIYLGVGLHSGYGSAPGSSSCSPRRVPLAARRARFSSRLFTPSKQPAPFGRFLP